MGRIQFRSSLFIDGVAGEALTYWKDSLRLIPRRVTNELFYREFLSESVRFVRSDFERLNAASFESEFIFVLEISENYGNNWQSYFRGKFYKTDFEEIDLDNKFILVNPEPDDIYRDLVDGMNKEFDLVRLSPERVDIEYQKNPVVQIYFEGSDFLFNVIDGVYWEEPVEQPLFAIDLAPLNFTFSDNHIFIPGDNLSPDVSGRYDFGGGAPYLRDDGVYRINFSGSGPSVQWFIEELATTNRVYEGVIGESPFGVPSGHNNQGTLFSSLSSGSTCRAFSAAAWSRILTDNLSIGGTPTIALPSPDIIQESFSYSRCLGVDLTGNIIPFGVINPNQKGMDE